MTAAISIDGLSKRYGALVALDGVDLRVEQGEFFGLLGPNGAGKTTLISVLAGLARASAGRVSVMGHDVVDDYRAARRHLGVVPQELVFDPFFTVRETLRMTLVHVLGPLRRVGGHSCAARHAHRRWSAHRRARSRG